MTPQEVLLRAAELLEANQWCQGAPFIDADGNKYEWTAALDPTFEPYAACAVGAICFAAGDDEAARNSAMDLMESYLAGGNKDVRPCVATWNDRRGRTKEEVVTTMRRAAKG